MPTLNVTGQGLPLARSTVQPVYAAIKALLPPPEVFNPWFPDSTTEVDWVHRQNYPLGGLRTLGAVCTLSLGMHHKYTLALGCVAHIMYLFCAYNSHYFFSREGGLASCSLQPVNVSQPGTASQGDSRPPPFCKRSRFHEFHHAARGLGISHHVDFHLGLV